MSEKSILEQALLQVQTLEEAVKQNAKGILASTMKQELKDLLRETEEESNEDETSKEEEKGVSDDEKSKDDKATETSEQDDDSEEKDDSEEEDEEGDEEDSDNEEEPMKGIDSLDSEMPSDEMGTDDMGGDSELDMPSMGMPDVDDSSDSLDLTGAPDEEVLKVFKAMKPEDGVIVKKDDDEIEIDLGDDEYIIKLDDEAEIDETMDNEAMPTETMVDEESWNEGDETSEETVYEIELGEDEDVTEDETEPKDGEVKEVEAQEAARTKWNIHGDKNESNRAGLKSKKVFKAGAINEEFETLKKQNAEYKKALVLFKEKLNEVAVFNANLAYATRLFTEHTTTKKEKLNILKRFDSVSTMNESKNLFKTIKTELETKKPVTESVVEKISTAPSTSSSQEMLAESKAYENPQFKRMKDLMGKIK